MANAKRLGHDDYALQIQLRIAGLAGLAFDDAIEREFWTAVSCAEEFKTAENGKTTRLARTRQKHARVGAMQCLTDWALDPKVTEGFRILLAAGRADLTGEAIVIRHKDRFPAEGGCQRANETSRAWCRRRLTAIPIGVPRESARPMARGNRVADPSKSRRNPAQMSPHRHLKLGMLSWVMRCSRRPHPE